MEVVLSKVVFDCCFKYVSVNFSCKLYIVKGYFY